MTETIEDLPYRVVDSQNHGWLRTSDDRYRGYDPTGGGRVLPERSLADVAAEFGPTRPVVMPTQPDQEEMRATYALAGRKLIGSIASAVDLVYREARERFGPWDRDPGKTADYARRTLTAGRPGSWESEALIEVVYFGNELNHSSAGKPGPNPRRVHLEARDQIAAVLRCWVASDDRYTEVAENLAALIAQYADDTHGAIGWEHIADQWLQPGGLTTMDFHACYRLLYSLSAHFDPALLD